MLLSTSKFFSTSKTVQWTLTGTRYYRLIHPTFPLLPHSKSRLYSRLNQAPNTLRAAFCVALDCAVRTSPSTRLKANPESRANSRVAAELISSSQYEDASSRTLASNILYIQTLTLMTLEADNHGPAATRGQIGPPRSEWLGRAIGMANHTKLNTPRFGESYAEDVDSDEKLGRRVWWILFILDRWNASSANSALLLPDNSSALLPDDQSVLGDTVYQLTRMLAASRWWRVLTHDRTFVHSRASCHNSTTAGIAHGSRVHCGTHHQYHPLGRGGTLPRVDGKRTARHAWSCASGVLACALDDHAANVVGYAARAVCAGEPDR